MSLVPVNKVDSIFFKVDFNLKKIYSALLRQEIRLLASYNKGLKVISNTLELKLDPVLNSRVLETPLGFVAKTNFFQGMDSGKMFMTINNDRPGILDTALKTADIGSIQRSRPTYYRWLDPRPFILNWARNPPKNKNV